MKACPAPPVIETRKRRTPRLETHSELLSILHELRRHPKAGSFFRHESLAALSALEAKLEANGYASEYEFTLDVRRMWTAAFQRFRAGSKDYIAAVQLSDLFERLVAGEDSQTEDPPARPPPPEPHVTPLTKSEKVILAQSINRLEKRYLLKIVEIVSGKRSLTVQEEFEFDIDQLSAKVAQELNVYVKQCMEKQTKPVLPLDPPEKGGESESASSSSSSSDSEEDNGVGCQGKVDGITQVASVGRVE